MIDFIFAALFINTINHLLNESYTTKNLVYPWMLRPAAPCRLHDALPGPASLAGHVHIRGR
jgi:hypothetical protein